jgi:hypothetical protein
MQGEPHTVREKSASAGSVKVLIWLWLCMLAACSGTCGDHIAELTGSSGRVQRDRNAERGQFSDVSTGDRFRLGDGMRTGPDGRAQLALRPEGIAIVEPNTLMRFLSEQPGKNHERIALEEGTIDIERAPLDLEVHTAQAIARLSLHGQVRISSTPDAGDRFDVLVGRVSIDHDGSTEQLEKGQSLTLNGKTRVAAAPAAPAPAPSAAPAAVTNEPAPLPTPKSTGPTRADLALPHENAVLHTQSLPARVRIDLPPCEEAARVEVGSGARSNRIHTEAHAEHTIASLEVGTHRIRVRCGDVLDSDVTLRVQRDAATQELPRSAVRVDVEADGRSYTVHYQNVLPALGFSWPHAPKADHFTLVITHGKTIQRKPSSAPELELRAGELNEGAYGFLFESADGARSRESSLRIVFDNMARSAYLSEPPVGAAIPENTVTVAGGALSRSEVSVGAQVLPLDAQGRFRGQVSLAPDEDSLTVRVKHPQAGVHYYLRRIRGADIYSRPE